MRRYGLLVVVAAALAAGTFCLKACGSGGDSGSTSATELPAGVRSAATKLLANVSIATSAEVIVAGPVTAGSVLRENRPENDTETAASLAVPSTNGTTYIFYIDDNPDQKHAHTVRYAWLDTGSDTVMTADAQYPMRIEEPGKTATPFSYSASEKVNDVTFYYATGHGEGDAASVASDQQEDGAAASASGSANSGGCYKMALVVDGGEERGYRMTALTADNMASDADTIKDYVSGNGFTVTRRSQYWGSSWPGFASREHRSFEARLDRFVEAFQGLGCGATQFCCHEFFLYIAAHGSASGFDLYPKSGGSASQREFYEDVMAKLRNLPTCVKTTVFVDVCQSGGMITRNQSPTDNLSAYCTGHSACGLSILTSTDATSSCPTGNIIDSATEDFMEGAGKDHDNDGKSGDIRDRFTEMDNQGGGKPQLYMCSGQTSMCSQD